MSAVANPNAPCCMARSIVSSSFFSSSAFGRRFSMPSTPCRILAMGANDPRLIDVPFFSSVRRYPSNPVQSKFSRYNWMACASLFSRVHSPGVSPSPITSVVMPCRMWLSPLPSTSSVTPDCACTSMKPGATTWLAASISSRPRPSTAPIATMRSEAMATSARRAGDPLPSMTSPLRITRSYFGAHAVPLDAPAISHENTKTRNETCFS